MGNVSSKFWLLTVKEFWSILSPTMVYIALALTMSKKYTASPSLGQYATSSMNIRKTYAHFHYRSLCIQRRWYEA